MSIFLDSLLGSISKVKCIKEEDLDLAIDLTSCAPGFIASIFQELVNAAERRQSALTKSDIEEMVIGTLSGTSKLLLEKKMSCSEVISRDATKGGITEEGVQILQSGLPKIFDDLFQQTLNKRKKIKEPDVVIFGHSHKSIVYVKDEILYINPGSAGLRRFRLPVSIARIQIENEQSIPEIIELL